EFDQSRQSYLALACANKFEVPLADGTNLVTAGFESGGYAECQPFDADSTFTAEAWLRIGEVHYDLDELVSALEAYAQVADDPQYDLYAEALIRIAWTLSLMRRFDEAAKKLDEFVVYADARKGSDDIGGAVGLRDDAVRYLAKT